MTDKKTRICPACFATLDAPTAGQINADDESAFRIGCGSECMEQRVRAWRADALREKTERAR
jgi:hypothetical protein